jgi:hypothetical protein
MDIAKWMVAFVALSLYLAVIVDAFIPNTARQHLKNPAWPPHAKFHNAQAMLMGALLGTLALVILFTAAPITFPFLACAAAVAATYYLAMEFATIFPGTAWYDPEFKDTFKRPLGLHPQQILGFVMLAISAGAVVLAWTRTHS